MGVENTSGTDTRTENAEQPPPRDDPPGPPPDRPGSPGQPSRLESLRAAREAQEARRTETQQTDQRDEGQEASSAEPTGERPDAPAGQTETPETESADASGTGERDRETGLFQPENGEVRQDGPVEPRPEPGAEPDGRREGEGAEPSPADLSDEKPETPAEPQTEQSRPDFGESKGEPEPTEGGEEQSRAQDTGETTSEPPDEREQPQQTREPDTEDPQNQDHRSLPQHDAQAPDTDDTGTGREPAIERTAPAEDEPTDHEHAPSDEPAPARAEQRDGDTEIGPPTEGDQQRASEEQSRTAETPERHDTSTPQVAWPQTSEEGVTRWTSPLVQFNERTPGTQVEIRDRNAEGQPETPAPTDTEENKYRNLPEPVADRTPGHGAPIPPEDDPARRDYLEPAPERRSRRTDGIRAVCYRPGDAAKSANDLADKAKKFLEQPPPKTQPTITKNAPAEMEATQTPLKAGNAAIGVIGLTIISIEAGRKVFAGGRRIGEMMGRAPGRDHGSNQ